MSRHPTADTMLLTVEFIAGGKPFNWTEIVPIEVAADPARWVKLLETGRRSIASTLAAEKAK